MSGNARREAMKKLRDDHREKKKNYANLCMLK